MRIFLKYIYLTSLILWIPFVSFSQEVKLGLPVGHVDSITNILYSPSGKLIASFSRDNTAKIWDVRSEKLIVSLPYVISSKEFGFVSDSLILLRVNENNASLYDLKNQKKTLTIDHWKKNTLSENNNQTMFPQKLNSVKIDPSNKFIIGIYQNSVVQFTNIHNHSKIEFILDGIETNDAKVNNSGKIFGLRNKKGLITLFDESRTQIFRKKFKKLKDFIFVGNDTLVLLYENSIQLWDFKNGIELKNIEINYTIIDFNIDSLNSKIYFFNKQNSLAEIDIKTGITSELLVHENKLINLLKFDPVLNKLVYGTSDTIEVLDIKSKTIVNKTSFKGDPSKIRVHIESNSYSTFKNKKIENFSLEDGSSISLFQNQIDPVLFASIDPINRKLYFVDNDLKEATLSLNNGEFQSFDKSKTVFLHTPYIHSIFDDMSKHQYINNLDSIRELYKIKYDTKTGFLSFNSAILDLNMQQRLGTRLRSSRKITEGLSLFNNKRLRIRTNQENIGFQVLQPDMVWSPFRKLGNHDAIINSLDSFDTSFDTFLVSASEDGSIVFWSMIHKRIITYYMIGGDPKKWIHIHPSGLFDASPEAMELMYWTKGLEVIEFEQLKYFYHEPGLWEKVMNGEKLREVPNIKELKLHPKVSVGVIKDGLVPVTFTKRDGGFGDITISINGVEISTETKGSKVDPTLEVQTVYYSIKDHPRLVNGENTITVNAASQGNIVQGRGAITVSSVKVKKYKPQFYTVVIGINEYSNPEINLNFPVNDANAIAKSVEMAANNLFTEGVHMYTITSETAIKPTKESIEKVFEEISTKAKAEDVILVHLSGHGVTVGDGLNNEFYFLTSDATSSSKEAYSLEFNREKQTISTSEWVTMLQSVNANKRIMIIDACGSGQAVDNLIAQRDLEGSQLKAIDRMKDRTGMFIISGSAADAVSYEASQYGQGLLTYSILEAMSGRALKEGKYVDIETVFNHARDRVPELAKGIGGIQKPQLLKPKGGSFDIGILEKEDQANVPLNLIKTVFARSVLVDKSKFRDVLHISKLLNEELGLLSTRGEDASVVYYDTDEHLNGCKITGGYSGTENDIVLEMTVKCGKKENLYNLSATSVKELVQKIIVLINE